MFGWWKTLTNSTAVIEKTTDAFISAGDKLFYTIEEKADMNLKLRQLHLETVKTMTPFKIAQRILAIWYSFLFGVAFLSGLGVAIVNVYLRYSFESMAHETTKKLVLLDSGPIIEIVGAFGLSTIVIIIVGFYFGGGTLESLRNLKGK